MRPSMVTTYLLRASRNSLGHRGIPRPSWFVPVASRSADSPCSVKAARPDLVGFLYGWQIEVLGSARNPAATEVILAPCACRPPVAAWHGAPRLPPCPWVSRPGGLHPSQDRLEASLSGLFQRNPLRRQGKGEGCGGSLAPWIDQDWPSPRAPASRGNASRPNQTRPSRKAGSVTNARTSCRIRFRHPQCRNRMQPLRPSGAAS